MALLNLFVSDRDYDQEILQSSYDAIQQKDSLLIIEDEAEKKSVLQEILNALPCPSWSTLSFQNLFSVSTNTGTFYLAQCLVDYGYPLSSSRSRVPSASRVYRFAAVGIAESAIDMGRTLLRPETKTDRIVNRLFHHDIQFESFEKFNERYFIASNKKGVVLQSFNPAFIDTLTKYDHMQLIINNRQMFICFDNDLEPGHLRAIEDVFSHCNFIASIPSGKL